MGTLICPAVFFSDDSIECQNGGTPYYQLQDADNYNGEWACSCTSQFTGKHCETSKLLLSDYLLLMNTKYRSTSVARTLMARLPWLFRIHF